MRNAMICVSVMLAVFLGWPLAFGGKDRGLETTAAEARAVIPVAAAAPAAEAKVAPVAAAMPAQPESCYKRYQREVKQCSGSAGAACRLKSADHWDLCEATGFWPD